MAAKQECGGWDVQRVGILPLLVGASSNLVRGGFSMGIIAQGDLNALHANALHAYSWLV